MQQKNIVTCILLSYVTCGIYYFLWFISLTDDTNQVSGMPTASGGTAFLYSLITCGIYFVYWYYKLGEKLDAAAGDGGNRAVLYLILGILGLGIVSFALAQDELNKLQQQY